MSLDTEVRRDTNPTPTRFLLECEQIAPGFNFSLGSPYSPYDTSYKFLSTNTPKAESEPFDTTFKASSSTTAMQHPWSDMVLEEEEFMPFRQMSPSISSSSSISSISSSSSLDTPTSDPNAFPSRKMSTTSDHLISHPEATHCYTHEYNAVFDKLVPSTKPYSSDLEAPSLELDSPSPDSLVPGGTFRNGNGMNKVGQGNLYHSCYPRGSDMQKDQKMSDHDDTDMDIDSNDDSNDESDHDESSSMKDSHASRESSSKSESIAPRVLRSRSAARRESSDTRKPYKTTRASKAAKASNAKKTSNTKSASTRRKAKSLTMNTVNTLSGGAIRSSSRSRKHSLVDDDEPPEVKRQKFLERNRVAASKCREKKRQQTLKTIADADEITARNQTLHETLTELQEEVRTLKNQILCHRDCGCDVIQKFVQSSFGKGSFTARGTDLSQRSTLSC